MLRSKVNSLGNPCDQSSRRKEGCGGKEIPKYMDVVHKSDSLDAGG